MKKTTYLNYRKHLCVHKLRNSELKATLGGQSSGTDCKQDVVTCGSQGDECTTLTVVLNTAVATHKVIIDK